MSKDPIKSPFTSPSKSGLHPHALPSMGKENPQGMYESENNLFDAIDTDPLRGMPLGQPTQSGGILQFAKDHPFLSALAVLGVGSLVYKAVTDDPFEEVSGDRIKNPEELTGSVSPRESIAGGYEGPYIDVPFDVIPSSKPVQSRPPTPGGGVASQSGNVGNSIVITTEALAQLRGEDIAAIQKKSEKKEAKPKNGRRGRKVTQQRNQSGQFTSKKIPKRRYKRDKGTGKFTKK